MSFAVGHYERHTKATQLVEKIGKHLDFVRPEALNDVHVGSTLCRPFEATSIV